jgi:DNA (cytosine-5)-methyltransferase 1
MDSLPPREDIREINNTRDGKKNRQALSNLREAVVDQKYQTMWPTPRSTDGTKGSRTEEGSRRELERGKNVDLGMVVKLFPTPTAGDSKNAANKTAVRKDGSNHHSGTTLVDYARMFPTPTATDGKGAGKTGSLRDRLDYAAERGATKSNEYDSPSPTGGQLNPTWVEWLMGFPSEWTALDASATQ